MRTTVNIDDELLAEARVIAARTHRTVGSVLEDALRKLIAERTETPQPSALPDFDYPGGLRPGVDLYDKQVMAEVLDEDNHGHAVL